MIDNNYCSFITVREGDKENPSKATSATGVDMEYFERNRVYEEKENDYDDVCCFTNGIVLL
jgi:hypothetical protein